MTNKYVQRKTVKISVCLHNKRTTYYQRNNNIRGVSKGHDMSAAVSDRPPPPQFEGPPMEEDSALRLHMMNAEGEGATPLMYACQQGRDADLRSIIAKKSSAVRERDRTLKTALHYCAENSSLICAETILSAAPDMLDAKDEDGYTALHLAVIAGNTPFLKLLLSKGADVNCLDNEGHSAVHWATVCGELEALENVLASGATASTPDMHGGYPLHYAAQMCGPTSDRDGILRIGLAVLRTLLNHGVEVNATDQDGRQPILWAASAGSADAILALVNAGASVEADDKDGLTALHCAASRGHTDCLETLLSLCGASVDVMDSNGCTALFYAVTLGHADATQLLLEHGAQPNRQDRKGRTPAHCGAAKGQLETLRLLSGRGANMWARNVKGDYPLHEAVSSGRKDLVRWLLSQRPDAVNASNNDGRCPLHIAAINNNVEICKILLDSESLVNPVMRTSKGQMMTPLDAALHKGNRGCAKYLQLHGGVPATKLTSHSAALRGAKHRLEPHSDQITTPDWGPNLPVPEMRVSQSLVPSPVELNGHKHLTVVDANSRTFEVRVEDEIHRSDRRPFSDSSIEERARRRRRKRRPRREEESEKESDSDERRRRRRRRRKKREDSSEEESELERRRRRRKSQRGKYSDDSDSDDKEKRKRKESKSQQKKQASKRRNDKENESKEDQTKYNTENQREDMSENKENKDDPINVHEIPTESRKFITEEIKTREVVKSKKVIEKKEKEKSSEKPNVSKSSKITSEEKKIEEQITKKTSEFIQSVPKDCDVLSQDVDDSTIQQVVTAIVHQEDGESKPTEETTQEIDLKEKETTGNALEEGEGQLPLTETISKEEDEEDIKNSSKTLGKPEENSNADNIETKICVNEDKENSELLKDEDFWGNEENEAEQSPKTNANQIELDTSDTRNADVNETCTENIDGPKVEDNDKQEVMLGIPNDVQNEFNKDEEINANDEDDRIRQENIAHKEDKAIPEDQKTIESEIHIIHTYDKIEEGIDSKEYHGIKDEDDKEYMTKEDNEIDLKSSEMVDEDKGLIKVYGQSEMSNEEMKGKLTLEDVSYVRRDRGRTRERGRQSRSSFEVVSPAHSAPEDDRDSETANSRNGADSSQLQDSGFEPSPRRDKHMMKRDASRIPRACRRPASQHPNNEVPEEQPSISSTVSVTQAVQNSMRKYHLERRIFHELLELKRLQIRAGRANEALLVKRLADDYRRAGLLIGLKQYNGEYNFRSFEKFLYDQLRLLQNSDRRLIPRLKPTDDLEKLTKALRRTRAGSTLLDNVPENPIFCTYGTHRCYHATHAYTGVPCAAYITRLNHHTVPKPGSQSGFLPRIDSGIRRAEGQGAEIAKCLRYVDPSRPVTLELSHGSEKQVISLPTEKLDKNKRYYVTFTIKGGEGKQPDSDKHQHAKSF